MKYGFDPIANPDAKILILGTLPSQESLRTGQYYANHRNAFWTIMEHLLGVQTDNDYEKRKSMLLNASIAVWDVAHQAERHGSLDANINSNSVIPNEFNDFLAQHHNIETICFNGKKAELLFRKDVFNSLAVDYQQSTFLILPSTSPALAALTLSEKIERWRIVTALLAV